MQHDTCCESHISVIGTILILDDLAPRLNEAIHKKKWLVCGKLMAWQILTRLHPNKKSAVLQQKIGYCVAAGTVIH